MRRRKTQTRRRQGELSRSQEFELIAQCGAVPPLHFADDADRKEAWTEFRDTLLASSRPGNRPSAWWAYDRPGAYEGCDVPETIVLFRLGEATQADIDDLAREAKYFSTHGVDLCRWNAATWQRVRETLKAWHGATMPVNATVGRAERF